MKPFLVVITAIWIYPIISLFILLAVNEKPKARKVMFILFAIPALTAVAGFLSGYSTINENIDWLLVSSIYLFISLIVWRIVLYPNKWVKAIGFLFALLVLGYGYYNGSVGFLGIAFTMAEYEHSGKIPITENLSYTESILGNATSEYRGKRIEIFANPERFSFLEHMVFERSYTDIEQFSRPAKVDYDAEENVVVFSIPRKGKGKYRLKGWSDTVDLDLQMK